MGFEEAMGAAAASMSEKLAGDGETEAEESSAAPNTDEGNEESEAKVDGTDEKSETKAGDEADEAKAGEKESKPAETQKVKTKGSRAEERIGQLTARAKTAEGERDALRKQLEELQAKPKSDPFEDRFKALEEQLKAVLEAKAEPKPKEKGFLEQLMESVEDVDGFTEGQMKRLERVLSPLQEKLAALESQNQTLSGSVTEARQVQVANEMRAELSQAEEAFPEVDEFLRKTGTSLQAAITRHWQSSAEAANIPAADIAAALKKQIDSFRGALAPEAPAPAATQEPAPAAAPVVASKAVDRSADTPKPKSWADAERAMKDRLQA